MDENGNFFSTEKHKKNQNSTFLFPLPKIHVLAKLEFELTIFWVRFKLKNSTRHIFLQNLLACKFGDMST